MQTQPSGSLVNAPAVVKFAFKNLRVDEKKNRWFATCCHCKHEFTDARGTTSSFTR
jgi:hypothetical protein